MEKVMGRKKNPDNKPREVEIKEKLEESRQVPTPTGRYGDYKAKEIFCAWWASERRKYDRPKELEDVLWAHLKSIGCDKPELFGKGIEHFGLRK